MPLHVEVQHRKPVKCRDSCVPTLAPISVHRLKRCLLCRPRSHGGRWRHQRLRRPRPNNCMPSCIGQPDPGLAVLPVNLNRHRGCDIDQRRYKLAFPESVGTILALKLTDSGVVHLTNHCGEILAVLGGVAVAQVKALPRDVRHEVAINGTSAAKRRLRPGQHRVCRV